MNHMRTSILVILALAMLTVSCRSKRLTVVDEEPPVVIAPVERPAPIPDPVIEEPVVEIPIRQERFSFQREEDKMIHEPNTYFVIVGSFRSNENAMRFSDTLRRQGFNPVMLLSETGFHRVSVNSYTNEESARARIMQVRRDFPEYHDTWLLIRTNR